MNPHSPHSRLLLARGLVPLARGFVPCSRGVSLCPRVSSVTVNVFPSRISILSGNSFSHRRLGIRSVVIESQSDSTSRSKALLLGGGKCDYAEIGSFGGRFCFYDQTLG